MDVHARLAHEFWVQMIVVGAFLWLVFGRPIIGSILMICGRTPKDQKDREE